MLPENVESLMAEIEAGDPLDFSQLAIDAEGARQLMANHFCDIDRRLGELGLGAEDRLEMMAAIAAHTMVENMLLQIGRLRHEDDADFHDWMRRHGIG